MDFDDEIENLHDAAFKTVLFKMCGFTFGGNGKMDKKLLIWRS